MNERILEQLENVPTGSEDAYSELEERLKALVVTSDKERARLNYELGLIKKWGIAKIFLFGAHLCRLGAVGLGIENYSYINYLLGITKVNPVRYDLPFERFFNEHKKFLFSFNFYVEKGKKGCLLKSLYEEFGKSLFIKGRDSESVYFVSSKPFESEIVKESVIIAKLNQEVYEENLSILTTKELDKLGFYSFTITEVNAIEHIEDMQISEQTILQKKNELFDCYHDDIQAFELIEELNPYLSCTENKLIYQEQFMEICNKVLGFSYSMADYYRRSLAKKNKENTLELKQSIMQKFPENGEKLFDYFYKTVLYSVSKAYVIACLVNQVSE